MTKYTLDRIIVGLFITVALLIALAVPRLAFAQNLLLGDFPPGSVMPDACVLKVTGGPVAVNDINGTVLPATTPPGVSFPLASITTFGKYTLTASCTWKASVVNGTNQGTVTTGGTASAAPFAFSYVAGPVTGLVGRLAP